MCICVCQCQPSAKLQPGDDAQSYGPILINGSPGNSVECESEEAEGKAGHRGRTWMLSEKHLQRHICAEFRGRAEFKSNQHGISLTDEEYFFGNERHLFALCRLNQNISNTHGCKTQAITFNDLCYTVCV